MSGEFGEDFKPAAGKADSSDKHDPFAAERGAFKGPDTTTKPDVHAVNSKDQLAVTGDNTEGPKAVEVLPTGKTQAERILAAQKAEHMTPQENALALETSLKEADRMFSILAKAGLGDTVVPGASYLAGLVQGDTPQKVNEFMDTIKKYIEK